MAKKILIRDLIKRLDKEFIQINKKIHDFEVNLDLLDKGYEEIMSIKSHAKISKSYTDEIKSNVAISNILDGIETLSKTTKTLSERADSTKSKIKEVNKFLEKFRTSRVYALSDQKMIFRFLSGFLDGFSEYFSFKPEFMGVIDLNKLALEVEGKKESSLIKVSYEKLPKLIEIAYQKGLKNFVIESHKLKMIFFKNHEIKIVAENEMIRKIDKSARESNIFVE